LSSLISQNTGVSPLRTIAWVVDAKVNGEVILSFQSKVTLNEKWKMEMP
jgi:hypothetical protein